METMNNIVISPVLSAGLVPSRPRPSADTDDQGRVPCTYGPRALKHGIKHYWVPIQFTIINILLNTLLMSRIYVYNTPPRASITMIYHRVTPGCNPLYPCIAINCVAFNVYGVLEGFYMWNTRASPEPEVIHIWRIGNLILVYMINM